VWPNPRVHDSKAARCRAYHSPARHPKRATRARVGVRITPRWFTLAGCLACAICACGRRASEADCRLIVDKSVELQMKELRLTSEDDIRRREEEVRAQLQSDIESCEGRRVTDRTISCVRTATSPRELDQCLR
jgi:hypothetical protein